MVAAPSERTVPLERLDGDHRLLAHGLEYGDRDREVRSGKELPDLLGECRVALRQAEIGSRGAVRRHHRKESILGDVDQLHAQHPAEERTREEMGGLMSREFESEVIFSAVEREREGGGSRLTPR